VLYAHLSADAIRSRDGEAAVWVENAGGQFLTAGHVAAWCGREDTTKVTVKPVIDLHTVQAFDGYQVPGPDRRTRRSPGPDLCVPLVRPARTPVRPGPHRALPADR
jgi:hypothetical protein